MKKLNITFCSFPDFSGNAKKLYEYMEQRYGSTMNLTWIVYNESSVQKLKSENINVILIGTEGFKKYISKTDVFFTTQGNLDGDKTDKSIYIELWHGIGPKPVGYLCNNPSSEDIRGYNNIRKIVDYILVPNDFWKVIYSAIFHIEPQRIKSLGMPLLEYFKESNGHYNLEKIGINVNKYKKIIIYMPTYKKGFNHEDIKNINLENIFNFKQYDEKVLDDFLKQNKYLLIIKRHPGDISKYKEFKSENIINIDDKLLLDNDLSINEIINGFDLMITDYSSIGTEFIYLKRPVIYINSEIKEYQKERGIVFSNYDFWCVGPKVNNINDLIKEINESLINDNYYRDERLKAYDLWFKGMPESPSKAICDFLFENSKIKKEIKVFKHKEDELEDRIEQLEKNIINKSSLYEKRIKELEQKIDDKEKEIQSIYNSNSWKVTKIFRQIREKRSKIE